MPQGISPSLYDYLDFREYLRDWFTWRDGAPSQGAFARQAHLSPSLLSAILKGARSLDTSRLDSFNKALGHGPDQADYFRHLVTYDQDGNGTTRKEAHRHLLARRHLERGRTAEDAMVALLSELELAAVTELSRCVDWRGEAQWVASRLHPPMAVEEAAEILVRLEDLGVFERDEAGRLVPMAALFSTGHTVSSGRLSRATADQHRAVLVRAREALQDVPAPRRQYGTMTVAVSAGALDELRRLTEGFMEQALALVDNDVRDKDEVYQVSVQVFPLTGGGDEG